MQRQATTRAASATTTMVHHSPSARRPIEAPVIDMDEIWATQQVENAKWVAMYAALMQGAMTAAMAAPPAKLKEGEEPEDISLDYEGLATEADHAYSRYAARLRNQR